MQVPGIFVYEQQYTLNPLHIETSCITGFVGIAERGPLHTPVYISSFDEYLKIFGNFDTVGNLPYSVYNYFKCGGSECIIIRAANDRYARQAQIKLKANTGYAVLEAKSPGIWGNYITARVWHEGEVLDNFLEVDTQNGLWVSLDAAELIPQDIVRLSLAGHQIYRTISKREGNKYFFDTPVKLLCRNTTVKIEKYFVSIALSCKDKNENYLHLSMNPFSDRYYLSHINERSVLCTVKAANNIKGIFQSISSIMASGGVDGIAEMTAGDFIGFYNGPNQYKGLGALESRDDIALIAVPDVTWLFSQTGTSQDDKEKAAHAVQAAMISQAERFPGRFAVLDIPNDHQGLKALTWVKKHDSSVAAAYYP
jgi:hypothetical protein